jgi:hypothetical protein
MHLIDTTQRLVPDKHRDAVQAILDWTINHIAKREALFVTHGWW